MQGRSGSRSRRSTNSCPQRSRPCYRAAARSGRRPAFPLDGFVRRIEDAGAARRVATLRWRPLVLRAPSSYAVPIDPSPLASLLLGYRQQPARSSRLATGAAGPEPRTNFRRAVLGAHSHRWGLAEHGARGSVKVATRPRRISFSPSAPTKTARPAP